MFYNSHLNTPCPERNLGTVILNYEYNIGKQKKNTKIFNFLWYKVLELLLYNMKGITKIKLATHFRILNKNV